MPTRIDKGRWDKQTGVQTGTRPQHCVRSVVSMLVKTRNLACFCDACRSGSDLSTGKPLKVKNEQNSLTKKSKLNSPSSPIQKSSTPVQARKSSSAVGHTKPKKTTCKESPSNSSCPCQQWGEGQGLRRHL